MLGLVTLDFGNTNPHAGLFQKSQDGWQLIKRVPLNELQLYLTQLDMNANNTSIVLSEVKPREEVVNQLQEQGFLLTRVKDYWRGNKFAGMPVHYAQTLGEDRLLEAFYTFKKLKTSALLINAGTFLTIDVVTENGFMGGYIIPGVDAYFSTFEKGEQLKDVPLKLSLSHDLPGETASAITNGYSAFALLAEKLVKKFNLPQIIITGGSEALWEGLFQEQHLPVVRQPDLIHHALHYWFTTQIEPL